MPDTPLRGRRGRDRRIAERIATDFAMRHAPPKPEKETDFDVAAVDAEVADARRRAAEALAQGGDERPARPASSAATRRPAGAPAQGTSRTGTGTATRKGGGQRIPDLSALPSLLAATGTFESLRERLAASGDTRRGKHVGLVAIPHGAKSYL